MQIFSRKNFIDLSKSQIRIHTQIKLLKKQKRREELHYTKTRLYKKENKTLIYNFQQTPYSNERRYIQDKSAQQSNIEANNSNKKSNRNNNNNDYSYKNFPRKQIPIQKQRSEEETQIMSEVEKIEVPINRSVHGVAKLGNPRSHSSKETPLTFILFRGTHCFFFSHFKSNRHQLCKSDTNACKRMKSRKGWRKREQEEKLGKGNWSLMIVKRRRGSKGNLRSEKGGRNRSPIGRRGRKEE